MALGTIPVVGGAVTLLAGPGLLLAGLLVMFAGATGLGDSLSPWPAPVKDNELTTTGIYGVIRHPLYSGEYRKKKLRCVCEGGWVGGWVRGDRAARLRLHSITCRPRGASGRWRDDRFLSRFR